ncbi:TPA: arginase [bacterium]|nr:arginase [bacterium]
MFTKKEKSSSLTPNTHFDPDAPAINEGIFGLPPKKDPQIAVIPVPWEATTSYRRGTRNGPKRLFDASMQVDLFDIDSGPVWQRGIEWSGINPIIEELCGRAKADSVRCIESGGKDTSAALRVDLLAEKVNEIVADSVKSHLGKKQIPAVIGGEHSVSFGAIKAFSDLSKEKIGILHIDAHSDLRPCYESFKWSHASVMHNVLEFCPNVGCIVQVGIRDLGKVEFDRIKKEKNRLKTFFDSKLAKELARGRSWLSLVEEVISALPKNIWISLDVDGLDPAYCPETGTPVPGGLSFRELVILFEEVSKVRKISGFDIVEIGDSEWDGNVAARLLYKLCGWAK